MGLLLVGSWYLWYLGKESNNSCRISFHEMFRRYLAGAFGVVLWSVAPQFSRAKPTKFCSWIVKCSVVKSARRLALRLLGWSSSVTGSLQRCSAIQQGKTYQILQLDGQVFSRKERSQVGAATVGLEQ
jgi:hypothetical protein